MTDKRYSSKKYSDYPVIVDNKDNTELTLDSVVKLLNEHEFWDKHNIQEHNELHKKVSYVAERRNEIQNKYHRSIQIIIVMAIVIICETLHIFGFV